MLGGRLRCELEEARFGSVLAMGHAQIGSPEREIRSY